MLLRNEKIGSVDVLYIEGEINLFNSPRVKAEIFDTLEKTINLIVDFSDVTYVDSTGIGTLIACSITVRKKSARLLFCNIGEEVMKIFSTTKVSNFFEIFDNQEQALEELEDE